MNQQNYHCNNTLDLVNIRILSYLFFLRSLYHGYQDMSIPYFTLLKFFSFLDQNVKKQSYLLHLDLKKIFVQLIVP